MVDMSKWRAREQKEITSDTEYSFSPGSKTIATIQKINAALEAATDPNATAEESKAAAAALRAEKARRAETFAIDENLVGGAAWDLKENNDNRTPIPLDPVALNEARLLCREAMTLITEEAASLVNHPDLAYAEYDIVSGKTRMKRPNYPYPEVIQARLPAYIRNDAANDSTSTDPASILVRTFVRDNDLYSQLVGDAPNPHRKYRPFVSMTLNEGHNSGSGIERRLCGLSLHAYHHHGPSFSNFSKDSHNAIGASRCLCISCTF
jgi:hypothetical protein